MNERQRRYRTSEKGRASAAARQRKYRSERKILSKPVIARGVLFAVEALPAYVLASRANFAREYAFRHGVHQDAYYKLLENAKVRGGFTRHGADNVAVTLGLHPGEIWPEWFGLTEEAV